MKLTYVCLLAASALLAETIYVTNSQDNTVNVIDTTTNQVVGLPITVGVNPQGIAFTPNGLFAYVSNRDEGTLSVINTSTRTVVNTISGFTSPFGLAFSPTNGNIAYVAQATTPGSVAVFNAANNQISLLSNIGAANTSVAFTPNGQFAYITGARTDTVEVINTGSETDVASIFMGVIPSVPVGIALTPNGQTAYVPCADLNQVKVISTLSNTITNSVGVGVFPGYVAIATTDDGTFAYVTNLTDGSVSVIDTLNNSIVPVPDGAAILVQSSPEGIATTLNGQYLYVANRDSNSVSVIDSSTNMLVAVPDGVAIMVGNQPYAIAVMPPLIPPPPPPSPLNSLNAVGNQLILINYLNANQSFLPSSLFSALDALIPAQLGAALNSISPARAAAASYASQQTAFTFSSGLGAHATGLRQGRLMGKTTALAAGAFQNDTLLVFNSDESVGEESSQEQIIPSRGTYVFSKDRPCSIWATGLGEFARQDSQNQVPAFNFTTAGGLFGLDYAGYEHCLLGAGGGFAHTRTHFDQSAGKNNMNSIFAFIYGTLFNPYFFVDLSVLASYNHFDNKRHVFFPGYNASARSKYNGWLLDPHIDLGVDIPFEWGAVEPFVGFDWALNCQDGYTESGAIPLNMRVQGQTSSMLRGEAGLMVYESWEFCKGMCILKESLSYVYQRPYSTGNVTATIVGAPNGNLQMTSFTAIQKFISPGLELFIKWRGDHSSLTLTYQGEFGTGYAQNEVLAKIAIYY